MAVRAGYAPSTRPREILSITRQLDLNRNELRTPWPDTVVEAALRGLEHAQGYPGWDAAGLRSELAHHYSTTTDHVVAAAGSAAVIAQAMLVARAGELVLPWPSFEALPGLASARGLTVRLTELRASDGAVDLDAVLAALNPSTSMILICTPNSPTGGGLRHRELVEFLAFVPESVLVLIDQAYAEFADHPDPPRPIDLTAVHPGVLVTRTFSKAYGLAGLRVGYGLARPDLTSRVELAGVPYAISAAAEGAAIEALRQPEALRAAVRRVRAERTTLADGLRDHHLQVRTGHGNFVWLPMPAQVPEVVQTLAARGVLVKGYPGHGIRISVGTEQDTDDLLHRWPSQVSHWPR
ncbi:pyridoxal phosphate-dependent aminotransferase [Pseudonocardia spinosispora]|uniref:pyridoxal phosphate-dependent aminotransferase n=1 Tax=Pseudonocardia spinosispora TaxID=103441 RepID=UPI000407911E|nr:aminotransferase class I/II-fold pyridoxal phosphate-dependent enzyme [Pseudonocardia spinosispora]